jgi:hypothetical protein
VATTVNAAPIAALRAVGVAPDTHGPTVNTARSPRDVDIVAEGLANDIRARIAAQPQALIVWDTSQEMVLARGAARCLGIEVLRASEVEGMLGLDRDLEYGVPVALLATQWSSQRLATLRKLISNRGGQTVAVAAALDSPPLTAERDVPTAALVTSDEATGFFS